mgnify:CR=1 FL=1|tara:strand:+ start:747 stop:1403 length:657 start_codon:yes stop_codon:yes gene_type:complete
MPFWTDVGAQGPEPKRQFRFKVNIPELAAGGGWYARSATKPTFTVSTSEHKFLNHTFYYPGSVTWNTVTISFVDPVNPDTTAQLLTKLTEAGYRVPGGEPGTANFDTRDFQTLAKKNSVAALGEITVQGLNAAGETVEQWQLNSAFIVGISFNDYDYGSEDLSTVDVELRYDWASYTNQEGIATAAPADTISPIVNLYNIEGEDTVDGNLIELAQPSG